MRGSAVLDNLDAVAECHVLDGPGELPEAAQPALGLLRAHADVVDHRQHTLSADATLRPRAPVAVPERVASCACQQRSRVTIATDGAASPTTLSRGTDAPSGEVEGHLNDEAERWLAQVANVRRHGTLGLAVAQRTLRYDVWSVSKQGRSVERTPLTDGGWFDEEQATLLWEPRPTGDELEVWDDDVEEWVTGIERFWRTHKGAYVVGNSAACHRIPNRIAAKLFIKYSLPSPPSDLEDAIGSLEA